MIRVRQFSPLFLGLLFLVGLTTDGWATAPFMVTAGPTSPPIGHYEFCLRTPQDCTATAAPSRRLVLTPQLWKTILDINFQVNTDIQPESDLDLYGKDEYWTYPTKAGDCEDYALLKQRDLAGAGIPASDLLLTVLRRPDGEGHAVLTVRTDRGDFVLDNLRSKVELWSDTEYTYLKVQSPADAGKWLKINDGRPPLVGSVE